MSVVAKRKTSAPKERLQEEPPLQWKSRAAEPEEPVVADEAEGFDQEASSDEDSGSDQGSGRTPDVEDAEDQEGAAEPRRARKANAPPGKTDAAHIGPSPVPLEDYSDSSEDELENRVGNVPMRWYDEHEHIGYNIKGEKIARKLAKKDELDKFLHSQEKRWTIYDPVEDKEVDLDKRDRQIIKNIQGGNFPEPEFDAYVAYGDIGPSLQTPVIELPAPKSRFVPSAWEQKRINYLVMAMKKGWVREQPRQRQKRPEIYNIWAKTESNDGAVAGRVEHIPAPKLRLPGHAESYNPPEEFLMTKEEIKAWQETDAADRPQNFVPSKFESMRRIPAYKDNIKERFERCLDIYLCPRKLVQKRWVDDPDSLLPQLPSPNDLRPFPSLQGMVYLGHTARVRCLSPDPTGQWLVSGSDDRSIIIWEVATGRLYRRFNVDAAVTCVGWCPAKENPVVVAGVGHRLLLINPGVGSLDLRERVDSLLSAKPVASAEGSWQPCSPEEIAGGIRMQIGHVKPVSRVVWHAKGDYFATVAPDAGRAQIRVHQLQRHHSQYPFSKSKGVVEIVRFHPTKAFFFVATQKYVRVYNLLKQVLTKKLQTGLKNIASMAVHPSGNHVLVGSYDRRVCWLDLELSKPYRTLKYHAAAVRQVAYHPRLPLFASCGDEGVVHVFHGTVYDDLSKDTLIVPLRILRGHNNVDHAGVLDCAFHPQQPWLFSAGADKTIRLFV